MTEIRGPAVDLDAFRVEGHCCGIRIPALMDLTGEGLLFDISAEMKAELFAAGVLTAEVKPEPPRNGWHQEPRFTPPAAALPRTSLCSR